MQIITPVSDGLHPKVSAPAPTFVGINVNFNNLIAHNLTEARAIIGQGLITNIFLRVSGKEVEYLVISP